MIDPLKFWLVNFCHVYFFSVRFPNMCKTRTTFYLFWQADPPGLPFYGSVLAFLRAGWEWWIQAGSVPFYLGSPLHIISSLFSHFYLFQNSIFQNMLKLGFWNFKPIFFRMQFSLVANFFYVVLVIWLSWYMHLKLIVWT